MCLGELVEVVRLTDGSTAFVRGQGRAGQVSLLTLDTAVTAGDWLLVHAGFALARLTPQEASEAADLRAGPRTM